MKKIRPVEAKYKKWFNSLDKTVVVLFNALIDGRLLLVVNGDVAEKMVSKKDLVGCGFSLDNINFLIENGMLARVASDNKFVLTNKFYELLFEYGIKLRLDKMSYGKNAAEGKALASRIKWCFKMCYETKKSIDFFWHWALINFEEEKYGEAYDIINMIDPGQFGEPESKHYCMISCYKNLFLYLLTFAANYGEKKLVDISSFRLKDMMYIPEGKSGNKYLKQIVNEILGFDFKKAAKTLHDNRNRGDKFYNHNEEYKTQFELLFVLLNKVIDRINRSIPKVLSRHVESKKFQYIVNLLKVEESQRPLGDKEKCILLVAEEIIRLLDGKMIPVAVVSNGTEANLREIHKLHKLISDKQYKSALDECLSDVKGPNLLYKLLNYLNELIDRREGPLSKFDTVELCDDLEYTNEVSDVVFAYSMCCDALIKGISIDDYSEKCGLTIECRRLMKLVYARICYYRAMNCYDFAYDCYYFGDVRYKDDYARAVSCFYEYMACGDKLVDEVTKGYTQLSGVVLEFLDDVIKYKNRIGVSGEVKKLARM